MQRIAVVPGSFDPVTLGHLDVIERAAGLYDELHVVVVHNPDKSALLPIAQRVVAHRALDRRRRHPRAASSWRRGAWACSSTTAPTSAPRVLVKGVRSQLDVAYETPMAIVNRHLAGVETVFLLPDPANAHVSSSLVRQVVGARRRRRALRAVVVADYLQAAMTP